MYVKQRIQCLCLFTLSLLGGQQQAQVTNDSNHDLTQLSLLQQLREARADTHTVAVRFKQTKQLALLDVTLTSEGWLFYQQPESLRYEVVKPIRSLLMHDGKKVRNYAYTEGRWRKLRSPAADAIGRVMQQIGHWIQGDFETDKKLFEIKVADDEKGVGAIVLTPVNKALKEFIQEIELRVEAAPDLRVTRVLIRESAEDLTTLTFTQEQHNGTLPKGTFNSPEASDACRAVFKEVESSDPN